MMMMTLTATDPSGFHPVLRRLRHCSEYRVKSCMLLCLTIAILLSSIDLTPEA